MENLIAWVKMKRAAHYRKLMDNALKNSLDYEHVHEHELGSYWYQKYLEYKHKYKKAGKV
jgi:hypothetical protein